MPNETHRFVTQLFSMFCLVVIGLAVTPPRVQGAILNVTVETNVIQVTDGCSLREAIENANNDAATHIDCPSGDAGLDTITFGGNVNTITNTALMSINEDLMIVGPVIIDSGGLSRTFTIASSATVTLEATTIQNSIDGAILISSGNLIATLCNFNNNASAPSGGGAINASGTGNDVDINGCLFDTNSSATGDGGAIQKGSNGTMNITASFFIDNTAGGTGGAIDTNGLGTITATAFVDNEAAGDTNNDGGGAIYFDSGASFTITASAFSGNLATGTAGRGGAIFSSGTSAPSALDINYSHFGSTPTPLPSPFDTLTDPNEAQGSSGAGGAIYTRTPTAILGTSFIGNISAGDGGAVASNTRNDSGSFIANSTFSDNMATDAGGAIYQFAESLTRGIDLINVTIANNTAGTGSGIYIDEFTGGNAQVGVSNSILADNTSDNCALDAGTLLIDDGDNLVFGGACPGITPVTTGDPQLEAAELTFSLPNIVTYVTPLDTGSAASGNGNPTTCSDFPILNLDQRNLPRPAGETDCDIGAFESDAVPEPSVQLGLATALLTLVALRAKHGKRLG